ncbi:MAG: MarR family transcriptional regulator [Acidimicrobiia bacterium]
MTDRVDSIIEEWQQRRPDLDTSALAVVSRVLRASHHLQATLDDIAAAYGLSHQGDLDVLTEIYRANPEHGLTPSSLADALLLTAGGMTVRLHRLQDAGLVSRTPNPHDGRGVLVRLTPKGIDLAEHALLTHLDAQANSIRSLSAVDRGELASLLRTLLEGLGDVPAFRPPISVERNHVGPSRARIGDRSKDRSHQHRA